MTKYNSWTHYFQCNRWSLALFPWSADPQLAPGERELLSASLPHFQLGEGSDGHGLLRRAQELAQQRGQSDLRLAMELFIQEEQRHAAVLGRFLDQEQIPRLSRHWVDRAFRRIRSLAGFEFMITVLTCAECVAIPYYTAVLEVTKNHLLRAIAQRILQDEAFHLEFQAENLTLCARSRGEFGRFFTATGQVLVLLATAILVYLLYRPLFTAAKMSPLRFFSLALGAYRPILNRLASTLTVAPDPKLAWLK